MKRPFDPDFYVAAVTVIPILYLALTLQGPIFQQLIERWQQSMDDALIRRFQLGTPKAKGDATVPVYVGLVGAAIIVSSAMDEFLSFLALYNHNSSPSLDKFTLWSIGGLLLVVGARPFIIFCETLLRLLIAARLMEFDRLDRTVFGPQSAQDAKANAELAAALLKKKPKPKSVPKDSDSADDE